MKRTTIVVTLAITGVAAGCGNVEEPVQSSTYDAVVNGLKGEYFANPNLSGTPSRVQTDAVVDFNWGAASPFPGTFPTDDFTVRWTGKVIPRYSQTYTFYVYSYDGARLWVNNQLVLDDWAWDEGEEWGTIALTAGVPYDIKLEYIEHGGAARVHLSWSSASETKKIIPTSQLTTGAAPPPPSLATADFEGENATCWGTRNTNGQTTSACGIWQAIGNWPIALASNERAHSGTRALKATFTNNEDSAMARLSVDADHIFVRYYDYYDTDFDFAAGMKTLRLQSFNDAAGVNYYDIIQYTTAVPSVPNSKDYCNRNDMATIALSLNPGFRWAEPQLSLQRNRWYAIETEIKLNTPGALDGEVRIWVDGVKILEATGINVRGTQTTRINRVSIGGWYSNGVNGNPCPNPSTPSRRYIDDVVVASQYIGP